MEVRCLEAGDPGVGATIRKLVLCFGAMLRLFRRLVAHTASDLGVSFEFSDSSVGR
jgi:hypothetical protein